MTGEWPPEWLVLVIMLAAVAGVFSTVTVLLATGTGLGVFTFAPEVALLSARPAVR